MRVLYLCYLILCLSSHISGKVYVTDCAQCHANGECKTDTGKYCQCQRGYLGNGTFCEAMTCENANNCNKNAICTTVRPSVTNCDCKPGYTGNGFYCLDNDECESPSTHDCHQHATCQNTDGSYSCSCNTMYTGNGTYCEASNCQNANPCSAYADCSVVSGRFFSCTCKTGYTGGLACRDIDECSLASLNECHQHATCTNTAGSYSCSCNSMYKGNGTHCEAKTCEDANPCHAKAYCSVKSTAFQCDCMEGYTGGLACVDVDECASSTLNDCHEHATCSNQPGSYSCACNKMYTGNGSFCEDIDECASSSLNDCHQHATCSNQPGSYSCSCNKMYVGNGSYCEAATCENANPCAESATCSLIGNAFNCVCKEGYAGLACTDIDECASSSLNDCHQHATCSNQPGSYSCSCNKMYVGNGSYCEAATCENSNPCSEEATCSLTGNAFQCTCKEGYAGLACTDIDDCAKSSLNDCHQHATCSNQPGSYSCSCNKMYIGNGSHCEAATCANANPCAAAATCSLNGNAFECTCKSGYAGLACTDIDECSAKEYPCHENAACTNSDGSYTCQCKTGYTGNGKLCFDCRACPDHSSCSVLSDQNTTCVCDNGYKDKNGVCTGSCHATNLTIGNETLTFEDTWLGEIRFSNEKCSSGRAKASITCSKVAGEFVFNESSYHTVPCELTLKSVASQLDWNVAESEDLEEGVSKLNVLVSSAEKLSEEDRNTFIEVIDVSANSLANKIDVVTLQTLKEVVVAANSITRSLISAVERTPDKNDTIVGQGQRMVNALQVFANKVSLNIPVVTVETENIRAEVKIDLPVDEPFYHYTSDSIKISIPQEAVEQAKSDEQTSSSRVARDLKSGNKSRKSIDERIVFVEYKGNVLFQTSEDIDWVVTVEIGENVKIQNLKTPIEFVSESANSSGLQTEPVPGKRQTKKSYPKCVFHVPENSSFSTEGCCLVRNTTKPTCRCDHLTSFAVLMAHEEVEDDVALSVVTTVGCIISVVGLIITIVLNITEKKNLGSRSSRQRTVTVFAHICITLLAVYVTFLVGVGRTENGKVCTAISVILHYLLLTTWCWTTIYSYAMYRALAVISNVFDEHFVKKSAALAYGIPVVAVGASLLTNLGPNTEKSNVIYCGEKATEKYIDPFQGYRAKNMCWITGNALKFGFLLPAGIFLLINYMFFSYVIYSLAGRRRKMRNHTSRRSSRREITAAASIATTLGLTWLFGYMMLISTDRDYFTTMSWIFTVTNVAQGFVLFIFAMLRRAELGEKLVDSVKTSFTSMSGNFSSRFRSIKHGKKYVVNKSAKDETTSTSSTTESTANIVRFDKNSVVTFDTAVSESKS